jgi:hypothetical protein
VNEPFADALAQLLPPDSYHLPSGRATTHKIFHGDARHPSHLLLPVIPTKAEEIREPAYRSIHSSSPSSTRQSILFAR